MFSHFLLLLLCLLRLLHGFFPLQSVSVVNYIRCIPELIPLGFSHWSSIWYLLSRNTNTSAHYCWFEITRSKVLKHWVDSLTHARRKRRKTDATAVLEPGRALPSGCDEARSASPGNCNAGPLPPRGKMRGWARGPWLLLGRKRNILWAWRGKYSSDEQSAVWNSFLLGEEMLPEASCAAKARGLKDCLSQPVMKGFPSFSYWTHVICYYLLKTGGWANKGYYF